VIRLGDKYRELYPRQGGRRVSIRRGFRTGVEYIAEIYSGKKYESTMIYQSWYRPLSLYTRDFRDRKPFFTTFTKNTCTRLTF